jgi:small basic protein
MAKLFNSISMDVVCALDAVLWQVNAYLQRPWNKWRANLVGNYFRGPTSFINFLAASAPSSS